MSAYAQTHPGAPGWWQPRCTSCGWRDEPCGDESEAQRIAEEHRCPVSVGTGYEDAYGNVWLYEDGQRRMLASGEAYFTTRGERRVVA